MKKYIVLIACAFLPSISYCQYDTVFHKAIIIKMNPGLMLEYPIGAGGELGGTVQVSLSDDFAVFVGVGYNITNPNYYQHNDPSPYSLASSHAYTLRAGFYRFYNENGYLSFQFFYRRWANTTVFNFNQNDQNWVDSYNSDIITSPFTSFEFGFPGSMTDYYINQCSVSVYSFDIVGGKQWLFGTHKHFLFEGFVGVGLRLKSIQVEELGSVVQNQSVYTPLAQPNYFTSNTGLPDMKLGIMIGYKL